MVGPHKCRLATRAGTSLVLALLSTLSWAKPIIANVGMIVRNEADGSPIEGAQITLSFIDPSETDKSKINVPGNKAKTDKVGFAAPRAYSGYVDSKVVSHIDIHALRALVEADGYKTFEGELRVFYVANRAGGKVWVFVDEVHLVPTLGTGESAAHLQAFRLTAAVEPLWGDYKTEFRLSVALEVPEVVQHEFPKDVMRVAYMGRSEDPQKPEVELKDDGKSFDKSPGDKVYSGIVHPPKDSGDQLIESIMIRLIPREDFHTYRSETGTSYRWTASNSGLTLGGYFYRWNTVVAVIETVPIRWAVADETKKARDLYMDKYGIPVRPPR